MAQCLHRYRFYWSEVLELYNESWWIYYCSRCDMYKGKRPGAKFFAINLAAAQYEIIDDYERARDEQVVNILAGI